MTQPGLFGDDEAPTPVVPLRDRMLLDALEREERVVERALKPDEAGAIAHDLAGRHDVDARCLRCTVDGRAALAKLAASRGTPEPPEPPRAGPARARATDPGTSHAAARSIDHLTARQHAILEVFDAAGPMSDERLVSSYPNMHANGRPLLPQSDSGIRTRRAELVDTGLLVDTGKRVQTLSGRSSIVWTITEAGRARLRGAAA